VNIDNIIELVVNGKWYIIYLFPIFAVIFLCLRKITFTIQKKRQSWLYFCEIYYISLSLTMIFTKLQTDAFWLWESSEDLDTILNRFFLCYAIYQIFVIVKRKLDSSANSDSYQSLKNLLNHLIICKESNMENEYLKLIQLFEDKAIKDKPTMLNPLCLDTFNQMKEYDFNDKNLLFALRTNSERLDHAIQTESFSWVESFLLNFSK
jgi:hypothetical protein